MTTSREQNLDSVLDRIEKQESAARRRALLYTVIPIVMATILLVYSSMRIQRETAEVQSLQQEVSLYNRQIDALVERSDSLRSELEKSEERLRNAVELNRFVHPIGFVDLKAIASRHPREARILETILNLRDRDVRWRLGGQNPEQGFDSPSFAMFILRELGKVEGLIQPGESLLNASRQLSQRLPQKSQPEVGDIVIYPAGYYLFYFRDERNNPFVIGMTPMGITALKPDFANPVGYRTAGL